MRPFHLDSLASNYKAITPRINKKPIIRRTWIKVTNATMNAKKQKIILRDNQSEVFLWAFC